MQLLLNHIQRDRSLPTCSHSTARPAYYFEVHSILQLFILMMHEFNNPVKTQILRQWYGSHHIRSFWILIIVAFILGKGKSKIDNSDLTDEVREIINRAHDAVKSTLTSEIRERNNDSRDTLVAVLKTLEKNNRKCRRPWARNSKNI